MITPTLSVSTACIIVVAFWFAVRFIRKKSRLPYPPGPRQLPIVGNAFDIDLKEPYVTYTEWGKIYGELVYSRIFGQDIIIVNSEKMARILAETRSTIYSDRPHSPLYRLFGADHITAFLEYGSEWKTHRKLLHLSLRHDTVDRYQELHLRGARQLLENIQRDSKGFYGHFDLYTVSVALEFTYGQMMDGKNDSIISIATSLAQNMTKGMTAERVGLLTALPILKYVPSWFPGAELQEEARKCRNMIASFSDIYFAKAKEQAEAGVLQASFVSDILQQGETEELAARQAAIGIYIAAGESVGVYDSLHAIDDKLALQTSSTLKVLVLAMILNPEIQNRVHAELDAVVGKGVLPTFEDRERLPYLQAVLFEVMRWHPITPLGASHATTASDIVEGYYIPRGTCILYDMICTRGAHLNTTGTIVIFNAWAMKNNDYDHPERFDPTRYLTADEKLTPDAMQDNSKFFGFGRRICPGRFFAYDALWAAAAVILSTFRFEKARDSFGNEIEINPVFPHGVLSYPSPYQCSIISRVDTACERR
ncbi:cytochrome P450 [Pisolithus marmoratus]|nr:cytochrome P450 [Pisolithus marmoratus]